MKKSESPNIGDVVVVDRVIKSNVRPDVEFGSFDFEAKGCYRKTLIQVLELNEQGSWHYMIGTELGGNEIYFVWMVDINQMNSEQNLSQGDVINVWYDPIGSCSMLIAQEATVIDVRDDEQIIICRLLDGSEKRFDPWFFRIHRVPDKAG